MFRIWQKILTTSSWSSVHRRFWRSQPVSYISYQMGTQNLDIVRNKYAVRSFEHSLAYINDPNVLFRHPKADFFLSCSSDYENVRKTLNNHESLVLPLYIPNFILENCKLNIELIESLRSDFFNYASATNTFDKKEIDIGCSLAAVFSLFPNHSHKRRLVAIKFVFYGFIFDDALEDMVSGNIMKPVGEHYLQNIRKITRGLGESLTDLKPFITDDTTRTVISLAERNQNVLSECMSEFAEVLTPKELDFVREMYLQFNEFVGYEVRLWAQKAPFGVMATLEERISCKHVGTGLQLLYYPMLLEEDITHFRIGSFYNNICCMADCDNNDIFSYFKEQFDSPTPNPFNIVGIHVANGLAQKEAFREAIKSRNKLTRAIEIGLLSMPIRQRESLQKALLCFLGTTQYYFTMPRYGWEAILLQNEI